jgi:hypothetical protein
MYKYFSWLSTHQVFRGNPAITAADKKKGWFLPNCQVTEVGWIVFGFFFNPLFVLLENFSVLDHGKKLC